MWSGSISGSTNSFLLHTPEPKGHVVHPTRESKRLHQYSPGNFLSASRSCWTSRNDPDRDRYTTLSRKLCSGVTKHSLARIFSIENFLNTPCSEEPLDFDAQGKEITNHELGLVQLARIFSIENFLNTPYPEEPLDFDAQGKEITNHELGLVQSSGVNHHVQFKVDAESNTSNTSNSGVKHQVQFTVDAGSNASNTTNCGYLDCNNGEDMVLSNITSQVELNMENVYNENLKVLDKEFGITYAPIDMTQAPVLQSQSFVRNYEELAFDASILDIQFEGCTPEDSHELPTYAYSNMQNDKREGTSTLTKQNLVEDSPLTNELPRVLSQKERRRLYNQKAAQRSREKRKTRVNELEAMEKFFNEVKPLLCNILIADTDTGSLKYAAILLRKQLKDLIAKNQNAAIAFGVSVGPGFNHTGQIVGAKRGRSPSMVRVGSCERLHKRH